MGGPGGCLKAPLGWSLGVPARLAAQGGRFWGFLGVPWGPLGWSLGWSLGVPDRLAAQGGRFVASWHCAGGMVARLAAQGERFRALGKNYG